MTLTPSAAQSETAVLGGGCFWCLEASYQLVRGVTRVVPGYAGGHTSNPNYWKVARKDTGHAEVVKIEFDPVTITYAQILEIFWVIHDPTTPDRQGHDIGPEYRSLILTGSDDQRQVAETSRDAAQATWEHPIVTEIKPLEHFYEAEPEHHNYFRKNPNLAYCQVVINPKLAKLRSKFSQRGILKS